MGYEVANPRDEEFVANVQHYFAQEGNETLFHKRNTLKVVTHQEQTYVVKSFKIPHRLNQLIYRFFRPSKAKRSYENGLRLVTLGVNTPTPIGYHEYPSRFLFGESYYISGLFAYDFEIRAVLKDPAFEGREAILEAFVAFTYDLHTKGVYHVDYSPGNILVKALEGGYHFSLIDLNRMEFLSLDSALRMKSLAKLTSNREDNYTLVTLYAKHSGECVEELWGLLEGYLEKQQRYLSRKKRLKKLKG